MPGLSVIKKAISNPPLAARELNKRYYSLRHISGYNDRGIDITQSDWDNLIILDACRYDTFRSQSTIEGTLSCVQSKGSCTLEYLHANFGSKELHDTVYITANPVYHRSRDEIGAEFHEVINVWDEGGWSEQHGTVLPRRVNEFAKEAAAEYRNKRLLIHYVQPHYPFVGSGTEFDKHQINIPPSERSEDDVRFWFRLFSGDLDIDSSTVYHAYESNLLRVLESVQPLLDTLKGKSVVTSDHGNMFDERSFPLPVHEWGHPCGIYTSALVHVPWLVAPYEKRKTITTESPSEGSDTSSSGSVEDRLNDLGYL